MTDIKDRRINPYDPFGNETENCAYKPDYSEVDPRIKQPGYQIPLLPDKQERKGIRRYMNIVGLTLFASIIALNLVYIIIVGILSAFMADSAAYNALLDAENYMTYGSAIGISLNGILFLCANLGASMVGGKVSGIKFSSYFRPTGLKKWNFVKYMAIGIFIQAATGIIYTIVSAFMSSLGVEDFTADIDSFESIKSIVATTLYACVIAPVTEEILYRGFVLKNLSRVSQNFGIIVSAVLFGLAHENLSQFILAMPVGIFLARITIKHNSLLPSIGVHVAVNTMATVINLCTTYIPGAGAGTTTELMSGEIWGAIALFTIEVVYYFIAGAGLVFWIKELRCNRLPANTIRQSYRGVRIALSSPWLIAAAVFHFSMALFAVATQNMT